MLEWFADLGEEDTTKQGAQKGCPARPQRVKGRRVPLGYVEGLSDARTKLAGFFSALLGFGFAVIQMPVLPVEPGMA
jgi:hypothetical protein